MNLGNQMSCLGGQNYCFRAPCLDAFPTPGFPSAPSDNTRVVIPEVGDSIIKGPDGSGTFPVGNPVGSSTNTETLTSKPKRHILPTLAGVVGAYVLYKQFT